MPKTYFISDLHLSHKNILKYEPVRIELMKKYRPSINFETLTEEELLAIHDDILISEWNKVVKKDDIVWFLGDFAMGNREKIKSFIHQLNGHKRMIMGNHDNLPLRFYLDNGFEYVSKYPIILKKFFILSHAPLDYMNENMPFFNIFGHVHSHPAYQTKTKYSQCVSVERQNLIPIRIEEFDNYNPDTQD